MAAPKTVPGADGRLWVVRRNVEWHPPATGDDFEHDVDGGRGAVVLILSALFLFWIVLFLWAPTQVHVPWYLILIGIAVLLFFPGRWLARRQWTLVAETDEFQLGERHMEPEHWSGMVRGRTRAKEEMRVMTRNIKNRGTPAHADSPLHPVN